MFRAKDGMGALALCQRGQQYGTPTALLAVSRAHRSTRGWNSMVLGEVERMVAARRICIPLPHEATHVLARFSFMLQSYPTCAPQRRCSRSAAWALRALCSSL